MDGLNVRDGINFFLFWSLGFVFWFWIWFFLCGSYLVLGDLKYIFYLFFFMGLVFVVY